MQKDAQSYLVSKRMIALLRHGVPRDEDGATEFWEIAGGFQISFHKFCTLDNSNVDTPSSKRRRTKEEISVFVLITLGQKFLPPSDPRPLGRQTYGSVFTGRRVDSR